MLQLLAEQGKELPALYLVHHGASVDAINRLGETPLHSAVSGGLMRVTAALLDMGADPDAQTYSYSSNGGDCDGPFSAAPVSRQTPLHMAVERGNPDMVAVLLSQDRCQKQRRVLPNFNLKNSEGRSALGIAIANGSLPIARQLIEGKIHTAGMLNDVQTQTILCVNK